MNTKDKIVETTFLLSLEYGYDNVSIKQIKDKSEIAASSIYHHFKDKNDLLLNMINTYLLNTVEDNKKDIRNFEGSFIDKVRSLFYYSVGIDIKNKKPTILVEKYDIDYKEYYLMLSGIYHQHPEHRKIFNELNDGVLNFFKELIEKSKANHEIQTTISSKDMALFIFSTMRGTIDMWMSLSDYSLDNIINTQIKIIEKVID